MFRWRLAPHLAVVDWRADGVMKDGLKRVASQKERAAVEEQAKRCMMTVDCEGDLCYTTAKEGRGTRV